MGSKSIQEQFREQAELIDRLFVYRFAEYDKKMDVKLAALENRLEAKLETQLETKLEAKLEEKLETKLETKLEEKLSPIRTDLTFLKDSVRVILDRLT